MLFLYEKALALGPNVLFRLLVSGPLEKTSEANTASLISILKHMRIPEHKDNAR